MEKGTIIYKQFHKDTPLDKTEPKNMSGLQWFALEENYGSSYGDIHKKYIFRATRILNADFISFYISLMSFFLYISYY